MPKVDLAEFCSDFHTLCAGHPYSNEDVAIAYLDTTGESKGNGNGRVVHPGSFNDAVKALIPQVACYTGKDA